MIITLGKTELELLPEKAVFLPSYSTLILSDVHLGKAATFRHSGIPVPEGDDAADLKKITQLVHTYNANELIIAGDLFHSPAGLNATLKHLVQDWLDALEVTVTLVIGNHDKRTLRTPFSFNAVPFITVGGIHIIHDPADAPKNTPSICGHIHPVVKIAQGRVKVRLPCFHLADSLLTLPSFGALTGGQEVLKRPKSPDETYVIIKNKTLKI